MYEKKDIHQPATTIVFTFLCATLSRFIKIYREVKCRRVRGSKSWEKVFQSEKRGMNAFWLSLRDRDSKVLSPEKKRFYNNFYQFEVLNAMVTSESRL